MAENRILCQYQQKTLCVVTIAIICSTLDPPWKFQDFRRPAYNLVKHPWWSFIAKIVSVKYIHKKVPS